MMNYLLIGIGGFLATFGFGILFHIRKSYLIYAGIGGAIGGIVYRVALDIQGNEFIAMLLGSLAFSIYSEVMARMKKTPVTTFVVPALIPLVPGGGMYRMMLYAVQQNGDLMLAESIRTMSIAGALVLGILLASTFFHHFFKKGGVHYEKR